MKNENLTRVSEFILNGFLISSGLSIFIFLVVFVIYILTIFTNILIVVVVSSKPSLHKPMYFFISTFSFLEIWYPTATVPKFLSGLLTGKKSISLPGCITQYYFHFALATTENYLLVTMAFDRYVAICNPLRYMIIMKHSLCSWLVAICWVFGFLTPVLMAVETSTLNFCSANQIDHYFCDFAPLVILSCSKTNNVEFNFFVLASIVLLGSFFIIIISYICIILSIIRLSMASGRKKAFSTCASHFTVILIYYGTTIFMFVMPRKRSSLHINKIMSFFPAILTPLLNPIIYTLRNAEIMGALRKSILGEGKSKAILGEAKSKKK